MHFRQNYTCGVLAAGEEADAKPRFPGVSWWRALLSRWQREDRESYVCYALMVCCCVQGSLIALLNRSRAAMLQGTAFVTHCCVIRVDVHAAVLSCAPYIS